MKTDHYPYQATLSIGNNKYIRPGSDLTGCINDAKDMRDIIFQQGLMISEGQCAVLFDATRKDMDFGMDILFDNAPRLERIFYSHSGHGTQNADPNEPDNWEGAIVCADIEAQGDSWNQETIYTENRFESKLALVPDTCLFEAFLDLCYSGEFAESQRKEVVFERRSRYLSPPRRVIKPMFHRTVALRPNTVIWAACEAHQEAAEGFFEGKARGAFTYYLTKLYEPDMSRQEILVKVTEALRQEGYSQRPVLQCSESLKTLPIGIF
jgi:hypothetical protein